ncbi:MAG: RsmD family RNA methyltransferase [Christensenellaceae bacterium]|jgi:16S rRNA (guanine(966)-N(2))-methyltransferase RsmD|nr:RsmD family RNA methyltransferase [Christensenellaceae bacterium]
MRIIGGRLRGKSLEWVSNATTRPTTDRVKENIFNVLTSSGIDFTRANVLCLFSGSGQMGIECYSRGSENITFNDIDKNARDIIKKNCAVCNFVPHIYGFDYLDTLTKLKGQKFDLVFLDPPFADIGAPVKASSFLLSNNMLNPNAIIVAETETPDLEFGGFDVRVKNYGRAVIYFLCT